MSRRPKIIAKAKRFGTIHELPALAHVVDNLTTGLSREIWQKSMIVRSTESRAMRASDSTD